MKLYIRDETRPWLTGRVFEENEYDEARAYAQSIADRGGRPTDTDFSGRSSGSLSRLGTLFPFDDTASFWR